MTTHNTIEATGQLLQLVERAKKGEDVVITHDGQPVARITGLPQPAEPLAPRGMSEETIAWLIENRVERISPKDDAATLVRRIRDEEPE